MDHRKFFNSMNKLGNSPGEICLNTLGISADAIRENVILSPGWVPERMFAADEIEELIPASPLFQYKIWNVRRGAFAATYIRTGFGAPVVMDCVLLLGLTGRCRKICFVSSVGGLSPEMNIGDVVLPEFSACGDGAGRYLSDDFLLDPFGEKQFPDGELFEAFQTATCEICEKNNVRWHLGKIFCADTIVAQYAHLDKIIDMGFDSIDMESAAAFKAAAMLHIPMAAILNVSDNSVKEKGSLMSERSAEERKYRRFVAGEVILQIIEKVM